MTALHVLVPLTALLASLPARAAWWPQVQAAVAQEFSDLNDVGQITRTVLRLLLAALLGGLLGWERESEGKAAGLRTHMLTAMGAALTVSVVQQQGANLNEASRVIQGVIAGIGFLGAGAILKRQAGGREGVQGLTTAAGIWFTAAVGIAIGLGEESTAILSAVLAFCVLTLVPYLAPTPKRRPPTQASTAEPEPDPQPPPPP